MVYAGIAAKCHIFSTSEWGMNDTLFTVLAMPKREEIFASNQGAGLRNAGPGWTMNPLVPDLRYIRDWKIVATPHNVYDTLSYNTSETNGAIFILRNARGFQYHVLVLILWIMLNELNLQRPALNDRSRRLLLQCFIVHISAMIVEFERETLNRKKAATHR